MQTSAVPPGVCGVTRDQNKHDVRRVVTAMALAFFPVMLFRLIYSLFFKSVGLVLVIICSIF